MGQDESINDIGQLQELEIIVNGRRKPWRNTEIKFEQLVELGYGFFEKSFVTVYTVVYEGGVSERPRGTMVVGDSVPVKSGMIFNVTSTSKS
ncbi:MAG: multiubiquitin domain-containing protein [Chitinophagales bacterium]|nr:multiubiquitin domain-containing protein [Chitinophagales bacterium]